MIDANFFKRIKFNLKTEFGSPVVFLILDDKIGERISFYVDPNDSKSVQVFNTLLKECELNKEKNHNLSEFIETTQWGIELFLGDICITLIFHYKNNDKAVFRCCNEEMFFIFNDFMEKQ